jgi:hypothetical protein
MADYRAYTVGLDGHFINFQAFRCDDDPGAIEWARQFVDGQRSNSGAVNDSSRGWNSASQNRPRPSDGFVILPSQVDLAAAIKS